MVLLPDGRLAPSAAAVPRGGCTADRCAPTPPGGARLVPAREAGEHGLTEREREVLGYLHLGYTNQQIAAALGSAPRTVRNQLSSAYAMRALGYSLKGQYDSAISDYDAAIRINPDFAVALNNRAWAYFRSGRAQQGLPDVERSLKLNPLSEHSWDTRAHIRQASGNFTGAFDDYEKAVQIGGERMIRLYQCGLKENGLYNGPVDGLYTTDVRAALRTCSKTTTCDPLPADEQCRAATS